MHLLRGPSEPCCTAEYLRVAHWLVGVPSQTPAQSTVPMQPTAFSLSEVCAGAPSRPPSGCPAVSPHARSAPKPLSAGQPGPQPWEQLNSCSAEFLFPPPQSSLLT